MEREPQVGDRIDALLDHNADGNHATHARGQRPSGVVISIPPTPPAYETRYLVEFDAPFLGHDGRDNNVKSLRGFYISRMEITRAYENPDTIKAICADGYREYEAILAAQEMMGG